jgi:hypothetical protein
VAGTHAVTVVPAPGEPGAGGVGPAPAVVGDAEPHRRPIASEVDAQPAGSRVLDRVGDRLRAQVEQGDLRVLARHHVAGRGQLHGDRAARCEIGDRRPQAAAAQAGRREAPRQCQHLGGRRVQLAPSRLDRLGQLRGSAVDVDGPELRGRGVDLRQDLLAQPSGDRGALPVGGADQPASRRPQLGQLLHLRRLGALVQHGQPHRVGDCGPRGRVHQGR